MNALINGNNTTLALFMHENCTLLFQKHEQKFIVATFCSDIEPENSDDIDIEVIFNSFQKKSRLYTSRSLSGQDKKFQFLILRILKSFNRVWTFWMQYNGTPLIFYINFIYVNHTFGHDLMTLLCLKWFYFLRINYSSRGRIYWRLSGIFPLLGLP